MDWKKPDYAAIFAERMDRLQRIRDAAAEDPTVIDDLKAYYRSGADGICDFMTDWGMTYEPRNIEVGLPAIIPFMLWPKQREWVHWVYDLWRNRKRGLTEKSRDFGVSWLAVGMSCTMCLLNEGMTIGFGSRKEEYVDKSAKDRSVKPMKPLLPKARMFLEYLPAEFRGGWVSWRDAPYMRIAFPETGSIITGEAGDQIGRGDRTSLHFVDEHAYIDGADAVDAALSQTTNCQIDISSVRGMQNAFAQKRHSGRVPVFICDWHDDPRKDQVWYEKQQAELDPIIVAQEIDRDYMASVEGVVIPMAWLNACVGALETLGIAPAGHKRVGNDVADEGRDKCAAAGMHGVEVQHLDQWSGKGSDTFASTERAFLFCDENGYRDLRYDGDGLGAAVRGDARVINERRKEQGLPRIQVEGYRGSDGVIDPDGIVEGTVGGDGDKGRKNKDFFANRKAQSWWSLRRRARNTWRWVTQGIPCSPDDIFSIRKDLPLRDQLKTELGQVTYQFNGAGKMVIDKTPDGMKSPNLGDAVVICTAPGGVPAMQISPEVLKRAAMGASSRMLGERAAAMGARMGRRR